MKAGNIGSMIIRAYPDITNVRKYRDLPLFNYLMTCTEDSHVKEICDRLSRLEKSDPMYRELKGRQYACTISALSSDRKDSGSTVRNPLICIDIDAQDNPFMKTYDITERLLEKLFSLDCVYAAGRSVSGRGIYLIILLSSNTDDEDFRAAFRAIEQDFKRSGIVIDPSCKNVSRLRFASSYKPFLKKANEDIRPYNIRLMSEKRERREVVQPASEFYRGIPKKEILVEIVKLLKSYGYGYPKGEYLRWLRDAFCLYPLGEDGVRIFDYLSQGGPTYGGIDEVRSKLDNVSNSTCTFDDCFMHFCSVAKRYDKEYFNKAAAAAMKRLNGL